MKGPEGRRAEAHPTSALRHTAASVMLRNGVDIKTVSDIPGRCDAGFTLRTCTRTADRQQIEAADKMGSLTAQRQ